MLHSFAFSNFRAFREPAEVSFCLTPAEPVNGWAVQAPSGQRLTTALAVIGPNASGKTTLLQPLSFLAWFIAHSFSMPPEAELDITPHFGLEDEPSEFEIVADGNVPGSLYRYRLSTNSQRVLSESLEKQDTLRSKWRPIFDRNDTGHAYKITQSEEFGLAPEQAANVRPNVSLVSWARQYGVRMGEQVMRWITMANVDPRGLIPNHHAASLTYSAQHFVRNPSQQTRMRDLMKQMDLGLSDIDIREVVRVASSGSNVVDQKSEWVPYGLHRDGKRTFELPFHSESSGTQAAFNLLASLLQVIERGGLMIYDEFDSSLHPHLIEPLLTLFASPESNPKGAQIIFTTHATETVLRFLQKSQVVLVEKNGIESEAYRLDEMEGVRADENRAARYRAGAYGAIPRV